MFDLYIAILASLFSVVNPIGALPVYSSLTQRYNNAEKRKTARNTSFFFIMILLSFFLFGSYILSFFGVSISAIRLAGGLVILNSGFNLLNSKNLKAESINEKVKEEAAAKEDISFSPLAMPLLSGPGSISLLIALYAQYQDWESRWIIIAVILSVGIIVFLILSSATLIGKFLGEAGLKAIGRIMGFIIMAIACQYIISGIMSLVKNH